jgi:GNAT superfamily N-acetyltransferase
MASSGSSLSSHQDVAVRRARLSDLDILVRFSAAMAEETEGRKLDLERLRQGTSAVLGSTQRGEYLVAETRAAVIGQLLITYEWSDWRNGTFWWIQSVYVEPPMRRRGVFRTMHDYVLQEAQRRSDVCGIRLYVEKDNAGAHAAYRRLGMLMTAYQVYEQDFTL